MDQHTVLCQLMGLFWTQSPSLELLVVAGGQIERGEGRREEERGGEGRRGEGRGGRREEERGGEGREGRGGRREEEMEEIERIRKQLSVHNLALLVAPCFSSLHPAAL